VIVVVGALAWRPAEPQGPAGRACGVALAAAGRGARVELVGRVGEDFAGDALMLALTRSGVGHAAVLRDPARATPIVMPAGHDEAELSPLADELPVPRRPAVDAPRLEAADVDLAIRYLGDVGVLVVADDVPPGVLAAAAEAGQFSGSRLVALLDPGSQRAGSLPPDLPPDVTLLVAPDDASGEASGAFESLVGAFAAALDGGAAHAEAFAAATGDAGWEALAAPG